MLRAKGIHFIDVGTSGGVWGLERGYCMMIGGEHEPVARLDPIFSALGAGYGRNFSPLKAGRRAEQRNVDISIVVRRAPVISSK